ncbi:MAG: MATE family efflux transporter [Lachnospiraceae bacterium]|nr:MATE family efflux transporter [Lachnospiraceae bacterium]
MTRNRYMMNMTEGAPAGLLLRFMVPLLIGNIFQQVYNMVDTMIVGRTIGPDALAAVGATGSLNFLFFSLCGGLSMGIGILISQAFGAGNHDMVKRIITNAIYIMTAAAMIMGLLGFFLARRVLVFLHTPENIVDRSTVYMQIMCLGILAVSLYNGIASILRGIGDSKTPLYFLVISSVLNIFLDLFFILVLGTDVGGAAAATVLSQLISAVGSILFAVTKNPMFRLERSHWKPDPMLMTKCCMIGVPVAAQSSMIAVSLVILQAVVNSFGSTVGAAFTATSRIEILVQQPFNSLFAALSTFTGQNIGANRQDRVRQGFRQSTVMILIFSAVMIPVMQFFGDDLMGFFVDANDNADVIAYGARGLQITSMFFVPLGMINVFRGVMNGAGDGTYSLISGTSEMVGRIAFPKPLTMLPFVGVWGIWWGTALTWALVALASFARYRSGVWKTSGKIRA